MPGGWWCHDPASTRYAGRPTTAGVCACTPWIGFAQHRSRTLRHRHACGSAWLAWAPKHVIRQATKPHCGAFSLSPRGEIGKKINPTFSVDDNRSMEGFQKANTPMSTNRRCGFKGRGSNAQNPLIKRVLKPGGACHDPLVGGGSCASHGTTGRGPQARHTCGMEPW